ncbi:hypothetical protein PENSUB_8204 [Penicillium subrubescens]|uniref:Uncharacterized protein n=1 Tax=Penicillium subrubescens TaxID=1316194 RepID=A0A1Q5TID6_9EURO|nr:hypothetical protein PENSUB_8204 [Penicillium subrubescens]
MSVAKVPQTGLEGDPPHRRCRTCRGHSIIRSNRDHLSHNDQLKAFVKSLRT